VALKLTDIKAQDGGDMTMSGSATTVRWLLREGLLDELNLLVHPMSWSAMAWFGSFRRTSRASHSS
jgi:dihydrofolate reductase